MSLAQVEGAVSRGEPLPEDSIVLTFDGVRERVQGGVSASPGEELHRDGFRHFGLLRPF